MLLAAAGGAAAGLAANAAGGESRWVSVAVDAVAQPIGQVFLRLLFMLVVPLLFSAIVVGICDLDVRHLGRLGLRMMGYTVAVSTVAVLIGLALVNVLAPGRGLESAARAMTEGRAVAVTPAAAPSAGVSFVATLVPDNPIKAAASGDMIGLIVFSILFGIGLSTLRTPPADRLREVMQGLYEVSMKLVDGVLRLAPIGVAALLFAMTSKLGLGLLRHVAAYVGVVVLGLAIHMFVVYAISVRTLGGMSPLAFFSGSRLAMATAFSTSSSSATLPTALKVAEDNLGLPRHVARFVLTAGSAMNQNGTALFEGVTVLFLAQVFGVEMGLAKQALVMGICVLAGIGTAGVPAGSIPVIAMILGMLGIPVEGLALVLGVDRLLDMCRTTVNVTGDLAAAVYVARGEPHEAAAGPPR
jgi:DAACS family dicarboxylate/amino acid:cation (Na+ or H+) symporter